MHIKLQTVATVAFYAIFGSIALIMTSALFSFNVTMAAKDIGQTSTIAFVQYRICVFTAMIALASSAGIHVYVWKKILRSWFVSLWIITYNFLLEVVNMFHTKATPSLLLLLTIVIFVLLRRKNKSNFANDSFPKVPPPVHLQASQLVTKRTSGTTPEQQFWVDFVRKNFVHKDTQKLFVLFYKLPAAYLKWSIRTENPTSPELFRRQQWLVTLYKTILYLFSKDEAELEHALECLQILADNLNGLADAFHESIKTQSSDPEAFIAAKMAFSLALTRLELNFLDYMRSVYKVVCAKLANTEIPETIDIRSITTPEQFLYYFAQIFPEYR